MGQRPTKVRRDGKRLILLVFLFVLSIEVTQGQVPEGGEIFGTIGYGRLGDDEGTLGDGLSFGGGIGYPIFSRVGVELAVDAMNYSRGFGTGARFEGETLTLFGNVLYHFPGGNVRPYVLGGAGLLHSTRRSEFRFEGGVERFEFTDDRWAGNFGAGVKIAISQRIALRPEFRLLIGKGFMNILQGSTSVVYYW